jgi:uncharacterized protein (DUF2384 family)
MMTQTAASRPTLKARLTERYGLEGMYAFLRTPQPHLDDRRPADMILEGDAEEIHAMLDRLEAGVNV